MRKLVMVAVAMGFVHGAQAADMSDLPVLRGSFQDGPIAPRQMWEGFYIGGQAAYGTSDTTFSGSNSTLTAGAVATSLIEAETGVSQWPLAFSKQSQHGHGYGGFVGYNSQWDDIVVGLEMSYIHGKFGGSDEVELRRRFLLSDGDYHSIRSFASSSIAINDIGTFRARAGYAFGNFLPYMFGGLALGQADIVRRVEVNDRVDRGPTSTTPSRFLGDLQPQTAASGQYSRLIYGYTAGLGFDVNLVGGLFLRGEWEYVRFTSAVDTSINTVRGGIGYKF